VFKVIMLELFMYLTIEFATSAMMTILKIRM